MYSKSGTSIRILGVLENDTSSMQIIEFEFPLATQTNHLDQWWHSLIRRGQLDPPWLISVHFSTDIYWTKTKQTNFFINIYKQN